MYSMKQNTIKNIGRCISVMVLFTLILVWSFHFDGFAQTQTGNINIEIQVGENNNNNGGNGPPSDFLPPPDVLPNNQDELCGDGIITDSEQCDDGNLINGDGCSTICEFETLHSNVVQPIPDIINADSVDLDVNIFDPQSNLDFVLLFFSKDGGPFQQLSGQFVSAPIAMSNLEDGTYDVFSVAVDTDRNQEVQPVNPDATFTIDLVPTIDILAYPEKRIPSRGNWSTEGRLRFYQQGDQLYSYQYEMPTSDTGYAIVDHAVADGTYDVAFKGRSHLTKFIRNVNVQENADISLDYTLNDTDRLLAGDVQYQKDDIVNSLDLSATVLVLYQSDDDADLNKDGIVNSLDLSIEVINLLKVGEAP